MTCACCLVTVRHVLFSHIYNPPLHPNCHVFANNFLSMYFYEIHRIKNEHVEQTMSFIFSSGERFGGSGVETEYYVQADIC